MKRVLTIVIVIIAMANVLAQAPQKMSYQAVIRNSSNQLATNQSVGMQISILQGSATGTAVYVETQTPTTNDNGLVTIEIGTGTTADDFTAIDWTNGPYFIKTETDPTGGTNYTITGTSQILSVPYSLHSKTAETVVGTVNETDPIYTASQAANITATDITNLGNLSGVNTGDQDLSHLATKTALGDSTAKVRSEIPDVSGFISSETDPVFSASVSSDIAGIDTTNWNNKLDKEVDGDITNEIQNLSQILTQNNDGGASQIKNIADPTDAQDAATKAYVDELMDELFDQGVLKLRDVDGNLYDVVKIGNQRWMAENLKTTKFNDNTDIPLVTDYTAWSNLTTPGYCWYSNDQATYGDTYGALYNWYTVETGNLCPTGWHVPTDAEWTTLTVYLGGESIAGSKLKETGTTHWNSPNTDATNETGFTALPGGYRGPDGTFYFIGYHGYWWSSMESSTTNAWLRYMLYDYSNVYRVSYSKKYGLSVRCLRD
jgi:uncharacterized protein (TIGR02145 family)